MSTKVSWFAYHFRGHLVAVPLVFALFSKGHEWEGGIALFTISGVLFAAGLAIRVWCQQYLGYRLRQDTQLIASGPYAIVRNPIYIANVIMYVALTIASRVVQLVPVTLLTCFIVYGFVVRWEERKLLLLYGESYAAYMRETPRWIPRRLRAFSPEPPRIGPCASIWAEAYNLLYLIPFALKELVSIRSSGLG